MNRIQIIIVISIILVGSIFAYWSSVPHTEVQSSTNSSSEVSADKSDVTPSSTEVKREVAVIEPKNNPPKPVDINSMKSRITSFAFEFSHPSLGPYEEKSTRLLDASVISVEDLEAILNEVQINGVMSLGQYIDLTHSGDGGKMLESVREAYAVGLLNEGEQITDFVITFEDQSEIRFSDVNRTWNISGQEKLSEYFKEKGVTVIEDDADFINNEPAPLQGEE